jgi:formyl-CoA transferase
MTGGDDGMSHRPASQALARFKVLDLTRARAGPTAARQLADWGADVIKIELPGENSGLGGPRHGPDFQNLHRSKRSLTLDLKQPDGLALFKRLASESDVVVENFRPDVKHRLGIDYEALREINPRLVYGSISGFGQDGPYRDRPGVDQIAQGMGGLMSVTGEPGKGPMRVGIPISDLCTGMMLAYGIAVALLEREISGEGQWVQSSLLQTQIYMMDFQAARWLLGKEVPPQVGNNHPTISPTGVFETSDGYINIATAGDVLWQRLCLALGASKLAEEADYATREARAKNRAALNAAINTYTKQENSQAWVERLNEAGVPCGPIYTMDQVFADEQVKHLGIAETVQSPALGDIELVGQPIQMSRTPTALKQATPELSEHTDEVLTELGLGAEEIADLRSRNVI